MVICIGLTVVSCFCSIGAVQGVYPAYDSIHFCSAGMRCSCNTSSLARKGTQYETQHPTCNCCTREPAQAYEQLTTEKRAALARGSHIPCTRSKPPINIKAVPRYQACSRDQRADSPLPTANSKGPCSPLDYTPSMPCNCIGRFTFDACACEDGRQRPWIADPRGAVGYSPARVVLNLTCATLFHCFGNRCTAHFLDQPAQPRLRRRVRHCVLDSCQ